MNRWAAYGIFCCVKHGKQVKLEELEGSSFAYKDCHSEFGCSFFTQKSLLVGFVCKFIFFPVLLLGCKGKAWRSWGSWVLGNSAMLVTIHPPFCRSADKRLERSSATKKKERKKIKNFALPSLNDGPEHLLGRPDDPLKKHNSVMPWNRVNWDQQ